MRKVKWSALAIILVLATGLLCGCRNKSEEESQEKEKKGLFTPSFSAETSISYSAGNDSDWSYGNQRKEFPDGDPCYVRVASVVKTDKRKGVDTEITVMYRFTGTENCAVEISDGIATKVETDNPNEVVYQRKISAAKEKNAKESFVIFQYNPNNAKSVALEVIYDDQVEEKDDARNTVYFDKNLEE